MPDLILKRKVFEWPNGTLKVELQEDPDANIARVYIRWKLKSGPVQELDAAWSAKHRMAEIYEEYIANFSPLTHCPAWVDRKSITGTHMG